MVDTWEGSDVPGITRQRTGFESWDVVDELNHYHFHNFVGEGVGALNGRSVCNLTMMQDTGDLGFATVPDDASEKVQPFAPSRKWLLELS